MLVIEISPDTLDTNRCQSTMAPVGANRGGILRTGLPTDDDTRICRAGSGLVRHGVKKPKKTRKTAYSLVGPAVAICEMRAIEPPTRVIVHCVSARISPVAVPLQ